MIKYQYGCQNTAKEFLEHMYPMPHNPKFNKDLFYGISEEEYANGYQALWEVINNAYKVMIIRPEVYGLPLVEDREYETFNAKARDSLNSPKGLITLLIALAQAGTIINNYLEVEYIGFQNNLKLIPSKEKVYSPNKIIKCLIDSGFEISNFNGKNFEKGISNFLIEYPDNRNLIQVLKSLGTITKKNNDYRIFSFNYELFANPSTLFLSEAVYSFYQYLKDDEKDFYKIFHEKMIEVGFYYINSPSYRYSIEYFNNEKESYIVRCLSNDNNLIILLRTMNIDKYINYIEKLPDRIKYPYHNPVKCVDCMYLMYHKTRKKWTLDNITYNVCVHNSQVVIKDLCIEDIEYYIEILKLESNRIK